jgi:uncharacterized membrane protein
MSAMGTDARTPPKQPPLRLSTPLLMLWSLSQPARSDRDPPRMSRIDRMLAAVTTFVIGAMIALVVLLITPDRQGPIVGWMIIAGVAGILVGLPLWSSVWRRQHHPPR